MSAELITIKGACERLNLSLSTIKRLINRGELRAIKVGRVIRLRADDVQAWVDALPAKEVGHADA
jgi:excisionase family DNA binding protein